MGHASESKRGGYDQETKHLIDLSHAVTRPEQGQVMFGLFGANGIKACARASLVNRA